MTPLPSGDRPAVDETREVELQRRIEALRAELAGVQSGVLLEVEQRKNSPDLARTPNVIAQALGMSVQGVNNQLARMVKAGVLFRRSLRVDGGGRRFTYRVSRSVRRSLCLERPSGASEPEQLTQVADELSRLPSEHVEKRDELVSKLRSLAAGAHRAPTGREV